MGRARKAFADRLDRLLDGVDLKGLAKEIGLKDASAFSHYRTGERTPNVDRLAALARARNTTVDILLGLTNDPRPPSSVGRIPEERRKPCEFRCPNCEADLVVAITNGRRKAKRAPDSARVPSVGLEV